jgi:hypothetical protein
MKASVTSFSPEGTPMIAYLGLSSRPARVHNLSADRVELLTNFSYRLGTRTAVELANDAQSFKCILSLQVDRVDPDAAGGYHIEGKLSRRLTADELRDLMA